MDSTSSKSASALPPPPGLPQATVPLSYADQPPHHLPPAEPLITIEPGRKWAALNLNDLWTYRELLYFLTWRDIKVRYKQTALGAAWAILQPLFTMIIFTVFFGRLAGISSDGVSYPLFAYAGLLPWTYLSNALTMSGNSLVGNANLITKVYFPRAFIPGAAVAAGLVDFAITFALLIPLMLYYDVTPTWGLLLLLPLTVLTTLLALAVGMWMSALNVKYRDVRYATPFLIQIWMFASPIIYPASRLPEKWRLVYALNPAAGIVEGFRAALFGRQIGWGELAVSTVVTLLLLAFSIYSFRRMEKEFADLI
ncbi:MAG: ABC transporter permease [Pyrinomonadaceae bacterium]